MIGFATRRKLRQLLADEPQDISELDSFLVALVIAAAIALAVYVAGVLALLLLK